jgi:AcrR family transcriptional regulator
MIEPSAHQPQAKRRRTQDERSAETRRKLIQAAIDTICEMGFANATTTDIAERAGVSRGALQHQFGTRHDLLTAVGDQLTVDMLALSEDLSTRGQSVEARVRRAIDYYWSVYSGKTFLAVLNIHLGLKNDQGASSRLRRHFANAYRGSDGPWMDLFADTGLPRHRLAALRRIVLSTLRGLAVARFLGIIAGAVDAELSMLQSMIVAEMRRRPATAR